MRGLEAKLIVELDGARSKPRNYPFYLRLQFVRMRFAIILMLS